MAHQQSRVRAITRWLLSASSDQREEEESSDDGGDARSAIQHSFEFQSRRIVHLLQEHEGSAWQSDIVVETGWSRSKTSRVLSRMEQTGAITRYQFGRRKAVCLPERDPLELARPVD